MQFVRAVDVTNILAKKGKLVQLFYIKPDMTKMGAIPRTPIKIRNSSIYVYNKMHGRVIDTACVCACSILTKQL